jgi:prepilin peptidase CpaA
MPDVIAGALLVWALAIAAYDWRVRRVPNGLLLVLLLPAVIDLAWSGSGILGATPGNSLLGLLVGFGMTLPGYMLGRLGAGDVKLAGVVGFVLGWPFALWFLLLSALLLGAMSLSVVTLFGFANAKAVRIPAAVALAAGFMATVVSLREGWLSI